MTNNMPRNPANDTHIWLHKSDMDRQDIIKNPIFYMVEPTFYDPRPEVREAHNGYTENVFCKSADGRTFSPSVAMNQHQRLRELIVDLGGSVILGRGRAGQLDGPFTRDAGMAFMEVRKENNGIIEHVRLKTLTANFFHTARQDQGETEDYMAALSFMYKRLNEDFDGNTVGIDMHQSYEDRHVGEFGDFMYVPLLDILLAGHKPAWASSPEDGRTDRSFHDVVAQKFDFQGRVLPIEVANGYFHSDTSSKWLPNGKVVAYEGGMARHSFEALAKAAGHNNMIMTSKVDAQAYACNLLVIDQENIIMAAEVSKSLIRDIEKSGVKVHTTPLSQFTKLSGGGANCLTNRLNNIRTPNEDCQLPALDT